MSLGVGDGVENRSRMLCNLYVKHERVGRIVAKDVVAYEVFICSLDS